MYRFCPYPTLRTTGSQLRPGIPLKNRETEPIIAASKEIGDVEGGLTRPEPATGSIPPKTSHDRGKDSPAA
jgi:hypothetical protein